RRMLESVIIRPCPQCSLWYPALLLDLGPNVRQATALEEGRALRHGQAAYLHMRLVDELLPVAAPFQSLVHGFGADANESVVVVPLRLAVDERTEIHGQAIVVIRLAAFCIGNDLPFLGPSLSKQCVLFRERAQPLNNLNC